MTGACLVCEGRPVEQRSLNAPSHNGSEYDVIVMGGALSGAATAMLLLREVPQLKILIIEKSSTFSRRVGEATVEVSSYFLGRVLGMTQHLNESHLVKQGMRFWFYNDKTSSLGDCSEIGSLFLSRLPAFQVDRSVLDEELLRRASSMGAEVLRPATITKTTLQPGGRQTVVVRFGDETKTFTARWLVDASGVAAILARQEHWLKPNKAHPTTAVWARWTGVKDWDSVELARKYPEWSMACHGIRTTATNHLVGKGWWAWCIPLKGGDVSVGVVFDQRLVSFPEGGPLGQRLKDFLVQHPAGREILGDAQCREGDVHWRKNLPYSSTTFAGDGFVLVGDAAGFIDPFYSPGMDWIAYTSFSAGALILAQRKGETLQPLIQKHNQDFTRSYERWFEAIYRDKYEYMGEFDLMRIAFVLDVGFYAMGVASQPFKRGSKSLLEPVFSTLPSIPFYYLIRAYNRRFATIARRRKACDRLAKNNRASRFLIPGFTFAPHNSLKIMKGLFSWAWLELREGWRTWFVRGRQEPTLGVATPHGEPRAPALSPSSHPS